MRVQIRQIHSFQHFKLSLKLNMGNKLRKLNCLGHQNNGDGTLTITDICDDCLERIFDFLDLQSLLNVAQTCKQLQNAAADTFGYKFGREKFLMCLIYKRSNENYIKMIQYNNVFVYGLRNWAKFLRCFGDKFLRLQITSRCLPTEKFKLVDRYINQYCANTLTEIKFDSRNESLNDFFQNQFQKVETVCLNSVKLENNLANLPKWFPNLRHLVFLPFYDVSNNTDVFFPHLENFSLVTRFYPEDWTREKIPKLLQTNQHVQNLDICGYK